jgi:DNA polymerase III epsilon subunit-like protein
MTQAYDKPPKGYFKYVLAVDCETTGLDWEADDPSIGHQAISWGLVVADAETLIPIEELYLEVKWNDEMRAKRAADPEFGSGGTGIHGLTFAHLEEHGIPEDEAVVKILELIIKYWGPTQQVKCLGHNVISFDIPFLKSMLRRFGVEVRFGSRQIDTNGIGFATVGSYSSDALFAAMGFDNREGHNSLEDAKQALESTRRIRLLWDDFIGVKAYE